MLRDPSVRALFAILLIAGPSLLAPFSVASTNSAACGEIRMAASATSATIAPGGSATLFSFTLSRVPREERILSALHLQLASDSTASAADIAQVALHADGAAIAARTALVGADGAMTLSGLSFPLPRDNEGTPLRIDVRVTLASTVVDGRTLRLAAAPGGIVIQKAGEDEGCDADDLGGIGPTRIDVVATRLQLGGPAEVVSGSRFDMTVLAVDANGNRDLDAVGALGFTTTSPTSPAGLAPVLPLDATLVAGAAVVNATLHTAGPAEIHVASESLSPAQLGLQVLAASVARVRVSPSSAEMLPGRSATFTASITDAAGNALSVVPTWTASCGAIDAAGVFTAPAVAGPCVVTASAAGVGGNATALVTGTPLARLSVTPLETTAAVNTTVAFVATGTDAGGAPVAVSPTWTASCGAVTSAGLYRAPTTPGDCVVTATQGDLDASGLVRVVAGPLARLELAGPATLAAGATARYTIRGTDAYGNEVPLGNATLDWTAPTTVGLATVSHTEGGLTASLPVDVTAGPLARIELAGPATLVAGTNGTYALTGLDRYRNPVPLAQDTLLFVASTTAGPATVAYEEAGVRGELGIGIVPDALATIALAGADRAVANTTLTFTLSGADRYGNAVPLAQATLVWTAPTAAGTANATYTERGVTGTKPVSVVADALARIDVTGATRLVANTTSTYALAGYDRYGNPYALARTSLDFTAPTAAGPATVSYAESGVVGALAIVVDPAALARLEIDGPSTVVANTSASFTLAGYDAYGNLVALDPSTFTWTAPTGAGPATVAHTVSGVHAARPVTVLAADLARIDVSGADTLVANTSSVYGLAGFDAYGNPVALAQATLVWTAPTAAGPTAVAYTERGVTGTRAVLVVAGPLARITLAGPATVVAGASENYTLAGADAYGNPVALAVSRLEWTAPTLAGPSSVRYNESGVFAALGVAVVAGPLARIVVEGDTTIVAATTKTYALRGADAYGNAVPLARSSIDWTAPPVTGTGTVSYTESGVVGTLDVVVTADGLNAILITGETQIAVNSSKLYELRGLDRHGNPVTLQRSWIVWTAPTTPGPADVTYAEQGVTGRLGVNVTAGPLVRIDVSGADALVANATSTYLLRGSDAFGNDVPLANASLDVRAPTRAGPLTVAYTERGVTGTKAVLVLAGPLARIVLTGPATVVAGANATYAARGEDAFGNAVALAQPDVPWTAPTVAGLAAVRTSEAGVVGERAVTVVPAPLARILVTGNDTVVAGTTDVYALRGEDAYGNAVPLTRTETAYDAPTRVGLGAVYHNESGVVGVKPVSVVAGPLARIDVDGETSVVACRAYVYALRGADAHGNLVALAQATLTWTAPDAAGPRDVMYVERGVTGTRAVTVVAGPLARILVAGDATVPAGASRTYALVGEDALGNRVPLQRTSLAWTAPTRTGAAVVAYEEGGLRGELPVAVVPGPLARVVVTGPGVLAAGANATYDAAGRDAYGNRVVLPQETLLFTAPTTPGATRACLTHAGVRGCADVSVVAGPLARILVDGRVRVEAGTTTTYRLAGFDAYDNAVPLLRTTLAYVAPTRAQAAEVTYTESGVTGRRDVAIVAGPLAVLTVAGEEEVPAGTVAAYRVTGADRYGNWVATAREVIDWRAPLRVGPANVTYAESGVVGTLAVRVVAGSGGRLEILGDDTVPAGETRTYNVRGFSATGERIALGRDTVDYTAPAAVGAAVVCDRQAGLSGCKAVTVVPGSLARLVLSGPDRVVVGGSILFDLTGYDALGNRVVLPRTWFDWRAGDVAGPATACTTVLGVRGCRDVTVVADGPARLVITNGLVAREANARTPVTYGVALYDRNGNALAVDPVADIAWSIDSADGGAFVDNVLTPGTRAGLYAVRAQLRAMDAVFAVAPLTIAPGPIDRVEISPAAARVLATERVEFRATAYDAFGNRIATPKLTWFLDEPTVGIVNSTRGVFQAVGPGTTTLSAVTELHGILASAQVEVLGLETQVASLEIVPSAVTVASSSSETFGIRAFDADGRELTGLTATYSVADPAKGNVTQSGRFTADQVGLTQVVAKVGAVEARAEVTVVNGPVAALQVLPDAATLAEGGSVQFTATGVDARRNPIPDLRVTWSIDREDAGAITPDGLYTAGAANGNVIVTARAGVVSRQVVVHQWIQEVRAAAGTVTDVQAATTTSTAGNGLSTAWAMGVASAEAASTIAVASGAAPASSASPALSAAQVGLDRAASNLSVVVEVQPGDAPLLPEEVDPASWDAIMEEETSPPEAALFMTVQATEDGRRLPSADLNDLLGHMDVRFDVPESYFLSHRLDPSKVRLVEWSESVLIDANVPASRVTATPVDGRYAYTARLQSFSSFAFIAEPIPLTRTCLPEDLVRPAVPDAARATVATESPRDRPSIGIGSLGAPGSLVAGQPLEGDVTVLNTADRAASVNVTVRLVHSGTQAIYFEQRLGRQTVGSGGAARVEYSFSNTCLPAAQYTVQAFVEPADDSGVAVIGGVTEAQVELTMPAADPPAAPLAPVAPAPGAPTTPETIGNPLPPTILFPPTAPRPAPPTPAPEAVPIVSAGVLESSKGYTVRLRGIVTGVDEAEVGWHWIFDDGSSARGISPTHTFPAVPADRLVHVIAEHRGIRYATTVTVPVPGPNAAPVAAFMCAGSDDCTSSTTRVAFLDASTDANTDDALLHAWDFGDGTSSSEASPTHDFPGPGRYEVRLRITDGIAHAEAVRQVLITPAQRAAILSIEAPGQMLPGEDLRGRVLVVAPGVAPSALAVELLLVERRTGLQQASLRLTGGEAASTGTVAFPFDLQQPLVSTGPYELRARIVAPVESDAFAIALAVGARSARMTILDARATDAGGIEGLVEIENTGSAPLAMRPRIVFTDDSGTTRVVTLDLVSLEPGAKTTLSFGIPDAEGDGTIEAGAVDVTVGTSVLGDDEPVALSSRAPAPVETAEEPPVVVWPLLVIGGVLVVGAPVAYHVLRKPRPRVVVPVLVAGGAPERLAVVVDLNSVYADHTIPNAVANLPRLRHDLMRGRKPQVALALLVAGTPREAHVAMPGIARAGLRPRVVVAPTSTPASEAFREEMRAMVEAMPTRGATLVLASHDPGFAPILRIARQRGVRVHVVGLPSMIPFELAHAADEVRDITGWADPTHAIAR